MDSWAKRTSRQVQSGQCGQVHPTPPCGTPALAPHPPQIYGSGGEGREGEGRGEGGGGEDVFRHSHTMTPTWSAQNVHTIFECGTQVLEMLGVPDLALPLRRAGYRSVTAIFSATPDELAQAGLSERDAHRLIAAQPRGRSASFRADHPVLAFTTRGSRAIADARMSTPDARKRALEEIEELVYAPSTRISRDRIWETWLHFARVHWSCEPLPLTVDLVKRMAESMWKRHRPCCSEGLVRV